MLKLVKIILWMVGLGVATVVAAGVFLTLVFDPNEYRRDIEQLALEKGQVELKIGGDIEWSVFPWLGLELNQIRAGFAGKPQLAALNTARVSVQIMPLFSGQIVMRAIVLDGVDLTLIQQTVDRNNWTPPEVVVSQPSGTINGDLPPTTESDLPKVQASEPVDEERLSKISIDIESFALTNSRVRVQDKTAASELQLERVNLTTGRIAPETAIPLELGFEFHQRGASADSQLRALMQLATDLKFSLTEQTLDLNKLAGEIKLQTAALGPVTLPVSLKADIHADGKAQAVQIQNLSVDTVGVRLKGSAKAQAQPSIAFSAAIDSDPINLRDTLTALAMGSLIPETADQDVLKRLGLGLRVQGNDKAIKLDQLTLQLDDTHFKGDGGFNLSNGEIKLNLAGDRLNADRYLPPPAEPAPTTSEETPTAPPVELTAEERYPPTPILPAEGLALPNAEIRFSLEQLTIMKMTVDQILLALTSKDGLVNISNADANVYGGEIRNSLSANFRKAPFSYQLTHSIDKLPLGDVMQTLLDSQPISGMLDTKGKIKIQGNSVYDYVHSLNGTFHVGMRDGVVQGIDMAQEACQTLNEIKSLGINATEVDLSTPFTYASANLNMVNGLVTNPDLKVEMDAILLTGKGQVDLPKQKIDYRGWLNIQDALFKQTCSISESVEGVDWPAKCDSYFHTPPAEICKPDYAGIRTILKQKLGLDKVEAAAKKVKAELDAAKAKAAAEAKAQQQLAEQKAKEEAAKAEQQAREAAERAAEKAKEQATKEGEKALRKLFGG